MKEVTGNLQVKNGKYYVLVNLYDRSGKRSIKWVSLGLDSKGGKKAAKARMAEVLEEYNRNQRKLLRAVSKKKAPEQFIQQREQVQYQTVTEFLTDWINLSSGRLQPSTIDGYKKLVDGRITEFFGDSGITVGDLTGEDLNDFYACLEEAGLSGTSALRYHGLIHAAFKYAVKKELLDDNPCDHADRPKQERYRASFYSEEELKDLLTAARDSPVFIPIMLAAYYGLRRSEALGLKWSNIDFQTKTISISHKVIEANVDGKFQAKGFDRMKNQSSNRTLPLIEDVENELLYHRQQQKMNASVLWGAYCHEYDDHVCTDSTGKLLRPNYISTQFGKLLKENGFRHIRFHDLRHTCASLLLKNGVPMKAIQEWLGHSTFEVTANIYAHLDYSSKERSAAKIAQVLAIK
ncbi:MAG: site-specific integrase [Ruminococcus sp.]|nr:site-specific integrase [Ruminococcus sp.]MBR1822929.1 site-specific integrase [Ruminococcus sp.]